MVEAPEKDVTEARGSGRERTRPCEVSVATALDRLLQHSPPRLPVTVDLARAAGCILAQDVVAEQDDPAVDRARLDGLAVRVADAGGAVRVLGAVAAGSSWPGTVLGGTAVAVMTGATLPAGAEAVLRAEDVPQAGGVAHLPAEIRAGAGINRAGSACRRGALIAAAGEKATPLVLASLASFGRTAIAVRPRPRVAILTTGDELVDVGDPVGADQIRASNGVMLESLAALGGLDPVQCSRVPDDARALAAALTRCRGVDIVAVSGGTGRGSRDLTAAGLEAVGATLLARRVRQRPGASMILAASQETLWLGLPGPPLGCLVTFWRYVLTAGRAMAGVTQPERGWTGRLAAPLARQPDADLLVLARAVPDLAGGFQVWPLTGPGGFDALAPANALLDLPPGEDIAAVGAQVEFLPLPGLL